MSGSLKGINTGRLTVVFPIFRPPVVLTVRLLPHFAMRMLIRSRRFIMPTTTGTFKGTLSSFSGNFYPDGFNASIAGTFSKSITTFTVPSATITYDDLTDFSGTYDITSVSPPSFVGQTDVSITLENSSGKTLKITGKVVPPIGDKYSATGNGTWTLHKQ